MLPINEILAKTEKIMVKIEPTIKGEDGEWTPNKNYKLELIKGELKTINTQGGKIDKILYTCNIINDDGTKKQGVYEVFKLNREGELNYIIVKMVELDLDAGDIFFLGTDEKGFITINRLGKGSGEVEEIPTIDRDEDFSMEENDGEELSEDDLKNLPF
jgi:hypothetical protein